MTFGRLTVIAAVVIATALGIVSFLSNSPKGGSDRPIIIVASQKGGTKSLMLASGVLDGAPYDVEWAEFPAAQHLLEALAAGAVDVGAAGDAPFLFAYAGGAQIKAVQAARSNSNGQSVAIVVPGSSPIQSAADLRGKRIATGRGSIGHYLLLKILERENIAPSAVTIVLLSPGDAKAAFSSGDIDAWSTWGSYVGAAQLHDGARVVADGQGLLTGISFQAATKKAIVEKRPELVDFLKRLTRAYAWVAGNRDAYAAVLSRETGLPADVAAYTVRRAGLVPVAIDEALLREERDTLETFVRAGVIDKAPEIDEALDRSFNDTVVAQEDMP